MCRKEPLVSWKRLALLSLLALTLTGYRFGTGDHVTQFPSVLHFFDPQLYTTDFPLQMIFPPYLKIGLHVVLFSLARFLHVPVEYVYFFTHALVFLAFFWISKKLLYVLGLTIPEIFWGLLFLPFWAVFTPSLSHFQILVSHLVPYQCAVPLTLAGLYFFLKSRFFLSSILLGLAFLVHQQIGLLSFAAFNLGLLGEKLSSPKKFLKNLLPFQLPFLIVFGGYFFFLQTRGSHQGYPWFDPSWGQELLQMVRVRVPHHLLFSYARIGEIIFVGVMVLFVISYLKGLDQGEKPARRMCLIGLGFLMIMALGAFFTEVYPLPAAFALYPLRGDVFLRLMAYFLLVHWGSKALKDLSFPPLVKRIFRSSFFWAGLCLTLLFLGPHIRLHLPRKEVVRLCACVQEKTPRESFLLAPPTLKGVRLYCQRSVFVSWKAHGLFFRPAVAKEWFHRLTLLCALKDPLSCEGKECLALCRKNFSLLPLEDLLALSKEYKINYLLLERRPRKGLSPVCETEHLALYPIDP